MQDFKGRLLLTQSFFPLAYPHPNQLKILYFPFCSCANRYFTLMGGGRDQLKPQKETAKENENNSQFKDKREKKYNTIHDR